MAKIELRKKSGDSGKILTGANCELLIDGRKIAGATKFTLEVVAGGIAKATVELIGDFSMTEELGKLETIVRPLVPKESKRGKSTRK